MLHAAEHSAAGPVAHYLVLDRERFQRIADGGVVADEVRLVLDPGAAVEQHVVVGEQALQRHAIAFDLGAIERGHRAGQRGRQGGVRRGCRGGCDTQHQREQGGGQFHGDLRRSPATGRARLQR